MRGPHSAIVASLTVVVACGSRSELRLGERIDAPEKPAIPLRLTRHGLALGAQHSCAEWEGGARCWGLNHNGEVGDGTTTLRDRPTAVVDLEGVVDLGSGSAFDLRWPPITDKGPFRGSHTCAVVVGGRVRCWGANVFSLRPTGEQPWSDAYVTPIEIAGLPPSAGVSASVYHSCAVSTGGELDCWGLNSDGQLGAATPWSTREPMRVALGDVEQVVAADSWTCARTRAGRAWCWGQNTFGTGTREERSVPKPIDGLVGVVELAAFWTHTCARLDTGAVSCWGANQSGELGDGTTISGDTPVVVAGVSDARRIAVGGGFSCALLGDGTVRCWGSNGFGALGDGTGVDRLEPTLVDGLTDVVDIGAGRGHACARRRDGVWCWGVNESGQVGDGSRELRYRPVRVLP